MSFSNRIDSILEGQFGGIPLSSDYLRKNGFVQEAYTGDDIKRWPGGWVVRSKWAKNIGNGVVIYNEAGNQLRELSVALRFKHPLYPLGTYSLSRADNSLESRVSIERAADKLIATATRIWELFENTKFNGIIILSLDFSFNQGLVLNYNVDPGALKKKASLDDYDDVFGDLEVYSIEIPHSALIDGTAKTIIDRHIEDATKKESL